jgi:hypothetical protein
VLQDLTVSPMVSKVAYPKGKPLSGPEVDGIINDDNFTSDEVAPNRAVGAKRIKLLRLAWMAWENLMKQMR